MNAQLEHLNLTVTDPHATAAVLCELFDWQVSWSGPALNEGFTVHVGSGNNYLALYTHDSIASAQRAHTKLGNLNHIGVVVDDLATLEERVTRAGFSAFNHGDYEPGRRFYFHIADNIEVEAVSYSKAVSYTKTTSQKADGQENAISPALAQRACLAKTLSYLPFSNK